MSCTSSILLATLNQGWCKVKGENEWNAQRRINTLEANLWSRVQSVNLWSNLKSESYLLQGRSRMKRKNQKGRQFLHRPKGRQFLHRPRGQQFLHRPRRDNSFYTVPTFWERSNSFRTAPRYRIKKIENAQMPVKRGCNIWRRRGRSRRAAWKGATKNSKTPILSHSQLLGGWVG